MQEKQPLLSTSSLHSKASPQTLLGAQGKPCPPHPSPVAQPDLAGSHPPHFGPALVPAQHGASPTLCALGTQCCADGPGPTRVTVTSERGEVSNRERKEGPGSVGETQAPNISPVTLL